MRTISIFNNKGGIGKTTTAVNVGTGLARLGVGRILLLDLDSQRSMTTWLLGDEEPRYTVLDLYSGEEPRPVRLQENVDFIPSTRNMAALDMMLSGKRLREYSLKRQTEPLQEAYEYIVIDCPPAEGLTTLTALAATDVLLAPVLPEPTSYDALEKLYKLTDELREEGMNPALRIDGIVINRYNERSRIARETIERIRGRFQDAVLETVIRESVTHREAYRAHMDIYNYVFQGGRDARGANDFFALTQEILRKIQ